jgi:hypothetical protein
MCTLGAGCGRARQYNERGLNNGINEAGVPVAITFADYVTLPETIESKMPHGVIVEAIQANAGEFLTALQVADLYQHSPLVERNITLW